MRSPRPTFPTPCPCLCPRPRLRPNLRSYFLSFRADAVCPYGWLIVTIFILCNATQAQQPLPDLTPSELQLFNAGKIAFSHRFSIEEGLGPLFNERSCAGCHRFPEPGGDEGLCEHCLVTRATSLSGSTLHQRYSIGIERGDLARCREELSQELAAEERRTIRRPLSLSGVGLIEAIPDEAILALAKSERPNQGRAHLVIENNKRRIGRFGWKAQFATLESFTADSLLEEHGITTPLIKAENLYGINRSVTGCDQISDPEDRGDQILALVNFQKFLKPPTSAVKGKGLGLFKKIGCADCHTPLLRTGTDPLIPEALRDKEVPLFSDLLLHEMGEDGDGIPQGDARSSEMRTAPLWNLSTRFPSGPENPGSLYHNRRYYPNLIAGIIGHASSKENKAFDAIVRFRALSIEEQVLITQLLSSK